MAFPQTIHRWDFLCHNSYDPFCSLSWAQGFVSFINNIAFLPIRKGFFYVTIHAKIEIHSSWNLGLPYALLRERRAFVSFNFKHLVIWRVPTQCIFSNSQSCTTLVKLIFQWKLPLQHPCDSPLKPLYVEQYDIVWKNLLWYAFPCHKSCWNLTWVPSPTSNLEIFFQLSLYFTVS